MGSQIAIWMEADEATAQPAFAEVETLFINVERTLTRFNADSELSRLNANPGRWIPVSDLLWQVVAEALTQAAETEGLFDPTLLQALEEAGYLRSFETLTSVTDIKADNSHKQEVRSGRWQAVQLNPARKAVRLPPGVRLDFGGIAKGYTARQAVTLLQPWGSCLVDAGGDLVAGDAPASLPGWPVAVAAPWTGTGEETDLFTLWLANAAIATSGIDYRRWQINGQTVHHLIDPRTGRPAQTDALTVTVLAGEATRAEAWATAALVAGMETGASLLTQHGLAAVLVGTDNRITLTAAMAQYGHLGITIK